jgi:hypothetical protein
VSENAYWIQDTLFATGKVLLRPEERAVEKTIYLLLEGQNLFLSKEEPMGQTNEQQRHINEWPISELQREIDSIQTSLKNYFLSSSNNGMSSLSFSSGD